MKYIFISLYVAIATFFISGNASAQAAGYSVTSTVKLVFHRNDGEIWVKLDDMSANPAHCGGAGTVLNYYVIESENGAKDSLFASVLAAQHNSSSIRFYLRNDCDGTTRGIVQHGLSY